MTIRARKEHRQGMRALTGAQSGEEKDHRPSALGPSSDSLNV